jgi:hypothetical protein
LRLLIITSFIFASLEEPKPYQSFQTLPEFTSPSFAICQIIPILSISAFGLAFLPTPESKSIFHSFSFRFSVFLQLHLKYQFTFGISPITFLKLLFIFQEFYILLSTCQCSNPTNSHFITLFAFTVPFIIDACCLYTCKSMSLNFCSEHVI